MFLYSFLNEKQESKRKVDLWTLKQNRRSITGHSQIWGDYIVFVFVFVNVFEITFA